MGDRRKKSPADRAQEAYDVADRAVTRLGAKRDGLKTDLAAVEAEYDAARRRLDYVARNPDLPDQGTGPSTDTDTPQGDTDE